MASPNTLIFVDFPSPDPQAAAEFYGYVFGWEVEGRPAGDFHRIVPGGFFPGPDGSDSEVGNLHMGIYNTATGTPDPHPTPATGTAPATGALPRIWILVGDDDDEDAILARAEEKGAQVLWRGRFWSEFNGFHAAFRDPWGSQIMLWTKGGDDPQFTPDMEGKYQ